MFKINGQEVNLKTPNPMLAQIKLRPGGHMTVDGVTIRNDTNEIKTVAELAALKGA